MDEQTRFTKDDAIDLAASLGAALENELHAQRVVVQARKHSEYVKAIELERAYDDNLIEGKNADARARSEILFLHDNRRFVVADQSAIDAERIHALETVARKTTEAEVSLTKAWLYSQARMG